MSDLNVVTLTDLQHSDDRKGPWKLYIYEPGGQYHLGCVWFEDSPKYPEEGEIATREANDRCVQAMLSGREVRICDGGDNLVFHFDGKRVLHGENFWPEITR